MAYDRLSDTHGTPEEIKEIKLQRKKDNKANHKASQPIARMPISTPAGSKQRMIELREKLLTEGNSETMLRKLLTIATNDEHPGQMAAIKMCIDRMMPMSMFDEKASASRPAISITISGINEPEIKKIEGEILDG